VADSTVYAGSWDGYLYAVDAETGDERWRFETGDWVESSPSVADGTVYVGSNDRNLYAVDAETGDEQGRFETNDSLSSSPAVAGGIVYVGSDDGLLYAVGSGAQDAEDTASAPTQTDTTTEAPADAPTGTRTTEPTGGGDDNDDITLLPILAGALGIGGAGGLWYARSRAGGDRPSDTGGQPDAS
jgi:outer membrane protein assembly factor BamB